MYVRTKCILAIATLFGFARIAQGALYVDSAIEAVHVSPSDSLHGLNPQVVMRLGVDLPDSALSFEGDLSIGAQDEGLLLGSRSALLLHWDRYARLDPYITLGPGLYGLTGHGAKWQDGSAVQAFVELGLGWMYHLSERWALRSEVRYGFACSDQRMGMLSAGIGVRYTPEMSQSGDAAPEALGPREAGAEAYDKASAYVAVVEDVTPRTAKNAMVLLLHLNFKSDKATIPPSQMEALDELGRLIASAQYENPAVFVTITGTRPESAEAEATRDLSLARAKAVRTYLYAYGIDVTQIVAQAGEGSDMSVVLRGLTAAQREKVRKELIRKD